MPMPNLPIKTGHLFIGLALVMGVATLGVFSGGGGKQTTVKKVEEKIETEKVVVPLVPISQGVVVSSSDVTAVEWPSAFIPKGNVFSNTVDVVGRVAKQDLFPGEPIFNQKVSGSDTNGGLTAIIPVGKRAITIAVTETKGVAGFVKPGDFVDVLSTFELPNEGGGETLKKTRTVLQNVQVLASAQTMVQENKYSIETPEGVSRGEAKPKPVKTATEEAEAAKKEPETAEEIEKRAKERAKQKKEEQKEASLVSSVTLALTPEQAETIALAEESGELRLVLRPETDHAIATVEPVDSSSLKGGGAAPRRNNAAPKNFPKLPSRFTPPAPAMLGTQVEFIQGNDKTLYNFNQ